MFISETHIEKVRICIHEKDDDSEENSVVVHEEFV